MPGGDLDGDICEPFAGKTVMEIPIKKFDERLPRQHRSSKLLAAVAEKRLLCGTVQARDVRF